MSCSVNGIIAFGAPLGDQDDCRIIEHMLDEEGYPDLGEFLLKTFDPDVALNPDWEVQYRRRAVLEEECPVEIIHHGHYEFPRYFLAWKESVTEQRSYVRTRLTSKTLEMGPYEKSKMSEWIKKLRLPEDLELGWSLMSWYG